MGRFFNRERFGNAQIAAGLLLLIFAAECVWLVAHERPVSPDTRELHLFAVQEGYEQCHWRGVAGTPTVVNQAIGNKFDPDHSPLWYLIAAAPVALFSFSPEHWSYVWLTRAPYVAFGVLLGGSLWYVSRRLYGNAGGFVTLTLYCFSPTVIRASTLWYAPPEIGAAWGLFGAVFTAIAVSHTLYAPREVVLWNWRRIVLLAVSLALAIGSQFQLAIALPLLLVFMLYLAPTRKSAAGVILVSACVIALGLLCASYFFHPRSFWHGLLEARWLDLSRRALAMPGAYRQLSKEVLASGPVMVVLVPASMLAYVLWRRFRYFGNTAPLLVAVLFAVVRIGSPHPSDSIHSLVAVIFLFVFVAGISADLLESKHRTWILAALPGIIAANALWNLFSLWGIRR